MVPLYSVSASFFDAVVSKLPLRLTRLVRWCLGYHIPVFSLIERMFSFGIANNCKFFVSVLAIVYVLAVSSNTEDSITLKIAEDAGPTSIPFPENLCEDLKVCNCCHFLLKEERGICVGLSTIFHNGATT